MVWNNSSEFLKQLNKELKRFYDIEYQKELKAYWEYVRKIQKEKDFIDANLEIKIVLDTMEYLK